MDLKFREQLVKDTLTDLVGIDPYQYCILKRGIKTASILEGKIDESFMPNLNKEIYRKDFRGNEKFAADRVYSTLVEDYYEDYSKYVLHDILKRNGCDKDEVIHNNPITNKSDFISLKDGSHREVCSNFTGRFFSEGVMRFRDEKLPKLIEQSRTVETYIVGIDVLFQFYQLIKIHTGIKYIKLDSIPQFGGKPGHLIEIDKYAWKPLTQIPGYHKILINQQDKRIA